MPKKLETETIQYAEPWDDEIDGTLPVQRTPPSLDHSYNLHISKLASPLDMLKFSKRVAHKFSHSGISQKQLSRSLNEFLQSVHNMPTVTAVGVIDRRESFVAPIMEIFACWSNPIQLSTDSAEMRKLHVVNRETLRGFDSRLSSYLFIVDPRRYPIETFPAELAARAQSAAFSRLIACGVFER